MMEKHETNYQGDTYSWKDAIARSFGELRSGLPQFVVYDIIFKVVAFVLLSPVLAWLFRLLVSASGRRAIGNFDILYFLWSPAGLIALAVIVPAGFAVGFMELAGLMFIGRNAALGRRATWFDALRFVFAKYYRILGVSFLWLFLALVVVLPFIIAGGLTWRLLLSGHDINYYLFVRPPEFARALTIIIILFMAALVLLAGFFLSTVFALPAALFGEASSFQAFLHSLRLTRRSFRKTGFPLLAWLVCWAVGSAAVNTVLYLLESALVMTAGRKISLLVPVLGIITGVNALSAMFLTFIGTTFGCVMISRLYLWATGAPEAVSDPLAANGKGVWRQAYRKVWPAAVLLVLVLGTATSLGLLESLEFEDHVEITAHRGSSLAAPENTLSSIERAVVDGADYAEIDVQLTKDNVVVVAHDKDLMRLAGIPAFISESMYADLRNIDMGGHFSPQFEDERMPTLKEAASAAKGKIKLNVELKNYKRDVQTLVSEVIRILRETGMTDESIIMSLDYADVEEVRRVDPEMTVGYTPAVFLGNISKLDIDFLAVSAVLAEDGLIGVAHAQGKKIHVWTIDKPVDISLMIDRGVDNIITNDPAAVHRVLEERDELSNAEKILLRFRNLYVR